MIISMLFMDFNGHHVAIVHPKVCYLHLRETGFLQSFPVKHEKTSLYLGVLGYISDNLLILLYKKTFQVQSLSVAEGVFIF